MLSALELKTCPAGAGQVASWPETPLLLTDSLPVLIWRSGQDGKCIYFNKPWLDFTGRCLEQELGNGWSEGVHPDDLPHCLSVYRTAFTAREIFQMEYRLRRAEGEFRWVLDIGKPYYHTDGTFAGYVGACVDVTESKRALVVLQASEKRYQTLVANMPGAVFCGAVECPQTMEYLGDTIEKITGYPPSKLVGSGASCYAGIIYVKDLARVEKQRQALLRAGTPYVLEYRIVHRGGELRWVRESGQGISGTDGQLPYLTGVILEHPAYFAQCDESSIYRDIAEQRQHEQRIRHLAYHDALTGLPNRALFMDRLEQAMVQAGRHGRDLALLFVDLDCFKSINDSLGHPVGDGLLKQVGARLQGLLRAGDTVARLGGDEFVLLLPGLGDARDAAQVAGKAAAALGTPFTIEGHTLHVSASIGISLYPRDGSDSATFLKHADVALYRAKDRGGNTYVFYSSEMTREAAQRLELENGLRRALERGELCLHYQPQAEIQDLALTGVEALVRWQHPERGLVEPGEFIRIAEDSRLIVPLGHWVLHSACVQARVWQHAGFPAFRVGVNLSPRQFGCEQLVANVREILADTGLDPACLELELTESSMAENPERAIEMLRELRALGVQLALDDFGTGYSNLSYLKRFPLQRLKIDRSFMRDIPADAGDAAVVQAILAMAKRLKLGVVAEGVETDAQLAFLRAFGCDEIQGYALSRPLPAEAVPRFLTSTNVHTRAIKASKRISNVV